MRPVPHSPLLLLASISLFTLVTARVFTTTQDGETLVESVSTDLEGDMFTTVESTITKATKTTSTKSVSLSTPPTVTSVTYVPATGTIQDYSSYMASVNSVTSVSYASALSSAISAGEIKTTSDAQSSHVWSGTAATVLAAAVAVAIGSYEYIL